MIRVLIDGLAVSLFLAVLFIGAPLLGFWLAGGW